MKNIRVTLKRIDEAHSIGAKLLEKMMTEGNEDYHEVLKVLQILRDIENDIR
jgi:hypothetical protein